MIFNFVATLFLLLSATLVGAAPFRYVVRQTDATGGTDAALLCNTARFQVAGSIIQASSAARNLTQQLASDPTNSALIANVTQSLDSTQDAIASIATAVFAGQPVPAGANDQISLGMSQAFDVISTVNLTSVLDPLVVINVNIVKSALNFAGEAANEATTSCNTTSSS